jgi:hypothetical protein
MCPFGGRRTKWTKLDKTGRAGEPGGGAASGGLIDRAPGFIVRRSDTNIQLQSHGPYKSTAFVPDNSRSFPI